MVTVAFEHTKYGSLCPIIPSIDPVKDHNNKGADEGFESITTPMNEW